MRAAPVPRLAGEESVTPETASANFDRLATVYRWMEYASFGPWLWWCRCAFLRELATSRQALILGDGDGRFTARLLAANATVHVDAVDSSASMLRALVRQAGSRADRVAAHCADARCWQPGSLPYDLIVTHFFLDCFTTQEVRNLAEKMAGVAAPGALWVVSEFAVPRNWFGRLIAGPIVAALYWAFAVLTGLKVRRMPDYAAALRDAGFALERRRTRLGGLLVSELWRATCAAQE